MKRSGKTMRAIVFSSHTNCPIYCSNKKRARGIFKLSKDLGISIPYPKVIK